MAGLGGSAIGSNAPHDCCGCCGCGPSCCCCGRPIIGCCGSSTACGAAAAAPGSSGSSSAARANMNGARRRWRLATAGRRHMANVAKSARFCSMKMGCREVSYPTPEHREGVLTRCTARS
eukprot:scaffold117492_cov57-Phaeocystis_antarctica.AAC.2